MPLLISLKILFRYRILLFITILHLIGSYVYVLQYEYKDFVNYDSFIRLKDPTDYGYKYTTNKIIFYSENNFEVGSSVRVSGNCENYLVRNDDGFDYQKYLISNGIECVIVKPEVELLSAINHRYSFSNQVREYLSDTDLFGFKQTVILGYNSLDKFNKEIFINTHLSHLISLSGMHLSYLVIIMGVIVKKFVKTRELVIITTLMLLLIYFLLANQSYSLSRSFIVTSIIMLSNLFKYRISKLSILLVTINILMLNPFAIYSYGFIYSCVCYGVIILADKLNSYRLFLQILLFSLPITINLNNELNIIALVLSVPISVLFEVIYFPYLIISSVLSIYDYASEYLVWIISLISKIITVKIANQSFIAIILYYYNIFYKTVLSIVFLIVVIFFSNYQLNFKVYFIDVGQGDATLIMLKNGTNILIDSGGSGIESKNYNIAYYTIIPFLRGKGINTIDYYFASHGDSDHIGTLKYIDKEFRIKNLLINCNEINELEDISGAIQVSNYKLKSKSFSLTASCVSRGNENDSSLEILVSINGFKLLMMGDLSKEFENYDKQVDVLKVSHHGSNSSTSREFVQNINPKYSIISVGKNNYGHPTNEVLNNLSSSKIYRTDISGQVTLTISDVLSFECKLNC